MHIKIPMQLILSMVFLSLFGCTVGVTPYQQETTWNSIWDGRGGYTNEPAPGNLIKVVFTGDRFVSSGLAKRYVLLRIAELGKEKSMPYVAIFASLADAANYKISEPLSYEVENAYSAYAYVQYHYQYKKDDLSVNSLYEKYKKFKQF